MAKRERMTSVDTAWLRMDRPTNRMVIVGVLVLASRLDLQRVRALVTSRMLRYHRFRQRPVQDPAGAHWVDDPDFSLDHHVTRTRLPGKGTPAALKTLVGTLAGQALDPSHPLWELTVVDRYGAGSAVIIRVHHAYADGIALIGVMLSLTDEAPAASDGANSGDSGDSDAAAPSTESAGSGGGNALEQLFQPVSDVLARAVQYAGKALDTYFDTLRNPSKIVDYARIGAAFATEAAQLLAMPDDSKTRFKGKPGPAKRVAWTEPLSLEDVKTVGRAFGCSVNDVLLSCVAGALGRYLRERGDTTEGVELRALVPVNLRPPGRAHQLGNHFGLVALELPVGIAHPIVRVREVHSRMEALKRSYQAPVTMGMLSLVGVCPQPIQDQVLDLLANKATAVMTNVPGPQKPLYLAGARLSNMMFWVPQSGDIGMGVSILSYAGTVQFGLITDAGLTPEPEAIIAGFEPELEQLILTLMMEPWDEHREPALIEAELALAARAC